MKKITVYLVTVLFFLICIPIQVNAVSEKPPVSVVATAISASEEVSALLSRLEEIKSMEKADLSASDKKQLRQEVRLIKHDLKAVGGGVYLSATAIILVVLLIVLLL